MSRSAQRRRRLSWPRKARLLESSVMRSPSVLRLLALAFFMAATSSPALAAPGFIIQIRPSLDADTIEGRSRRLAAVLHESGTGLSAGAALGAGGRWQRVAAPDALTPARRSELEA